MKLPIPFLKKNMEENKYYLVLLIVDNKISCAVLEEINGKIHIISTHKEYTNSNFESLSQDEQINIIDKTISQAEEKLPPKIETHKTIFGVRNSWVEKETKKIKKEHLHRLKKICGKLDLSPIGFMVVDEAIANLLQAEEGNPISTILANIGKDSIHLILYRGGQISESVSGLIHESKTKTIDNLLKKFTAPVLPSTIIVTNNNDSNDLNKEINDHTWSKSLPFLHIPKITILPENFDLKSVIFGAATQLGFEIVGLHAFTDIKSVNLHEEPPLNAEANNKITEKLDSNSPIPQVSTNFGFIADEDIAEKPMSINEFIEKESTIPDEAENFNTQKLDQEDEKKLSDVPIKNELNKNENNNTDIDFPRNKKHLSKFMAMIKLINFPNLSAIKSSLKKRKKVKIMAIVGILILIIFAILFFSLFSRSKAEIILLVKPLEVVIEKDVLFSNSASNNFLKNVIASDEISTAVDGEASIKTSGKKEVGENATGSVTIYNSGGAPVSLNSGTEIKSSSGLTFTLDSDIRVASASGDIFSGTTPGTADVKVQAKEIGTESNLPSGTKFSVGGNNSLAGKNDNAFSGGSKKTVSVVSAKDLLDLKKELQNKLEKEAIKTLSEKSTFDTFVIPEILDIKFDKEKFDKKLNEEASQVKLNASLIFTSLTYKKAQINDYAKSILKDEYSENIIFADNSIKIDLVKPEKKDSNSINSKLKIKAGLLPEIDKSKVLDKIKNKSPKEARNMLSALAQVEKVDINYSPNLLLISNLFPKLPNDLTLTIKAK